VNERDLIERWDADRALYEAWGNHVIQRLNERLTQLIAPREIEYFIRIWPPNPRLKQMDTLVEKALYRGKGYKNPYADITDKVGVRYVVLVARDISIVEQSINEIDEWVASKDRDFEEERAANPMLFDYQSTHYIVRAARDLALHGVTIPHETPCEIQIRTLLQHAHSEVTHSTGIYKSRVNVSPDTKRAVAKSMALIEATNDYFEKVIDETRDELAPVRALSSRLADLYRVRVGREAVPTKAEGFILEAFGHKVDSTDQLFVELADLLDNKPFLLDRIRERAQAIQLYRLPAVLLLYLLAEKEPGQTKAKWPLTPDELRPIYSDLGRNLDES
jgi:ppGpp synthetase/RelA/SpoT-type nucleotidyltranferase